jgi:hypothetical protein
LAHPREALLFPKRPKRQKKYKKITKPTRRPRPNLGVRNLNFVESAILSNSLKIKNKINGFEIPTDQISNTFSIFEELRCIKSEKIFSWVLNI